VLASGGKTAAQPQMQEQAPLPASRLSGFQQTPAELRAMTHRLLTIESGASGLAIRTPRARSLSPKLSGASPPNRASRATIAFLESDRPDAPRAGDAS
jgi:hypothetical protein